MRRVYSAFAIGIIAFLELKGELDFVRRSGFPPGPRSFTGGAALLMAKLDLDWFRVFVEVYRTQSVSRAAERLGIAQSNTSIALNKLRLHFGDRLFSRTSAGMEPTPRAKALYPVVQEIVERLEAASGEPAEFAPGLSRRELRVCMTDISEVSLLPKLLNHLHRVAPGMTLEVEHASERSARRLESGEVDLAVGFMPDLEAGFYQQMLFAQSFVCLAAKNHPRISAKPTRKAFLAEEHIVITASGTGHSIIDKVFMEQGIKRRVVLRLPSFLGVAPIVARTELLVVVPRMLAEIMASQEPVIFVEPPAKLPAYSVKQHWHERFHADPANAWLRKTVAELFSGVQALRPAR